MGDLHSVAITPFSTMGVGGPRLSMKNSMFNTVRSRIGIKTSETAAKRYGVATLLSCARSPPAAQKKCGAGGAELLGLSEFFGMGPYGSHPFYSYFLTRSASLYS